MSEFRYRAFISYNHRDERWARWLHRALESYRLPRKLVGSPGRRGAIPRRLNPVFRDRDELSSAANLTAKVQGALAESESLVVVCSPAAVASRWVNEEIRAFRALGRGDRVFALIVDGDPQADDPAQACFPAALFESEHDESVEPLAADARKWADGRSLALLKLVAGILEIPLDSLRRRDLQRRQRRWVMITVAAVVAVLIATLAVTSRIAAEKRRAVTEELVGFKLNDLAGKLPILEPGAELARLQEWDPNEWQALLDAAGDTDEALLTAAMEYQEAGLSSRRQGERVAASRDFRLSWALFAERYRRQPTDRERLFDLGQAEYWLGQIAAELGEFSNAERSFGLYADISRRLLREEPENGLRVIEMVYALSNLGTLEMLRQPNDPDRALQFMQSALEYNQIALVLDPGNAGFRAELEQSHANAADAQMLICDLGGALHSRMESADLAREFQAAMPADRHKKALLAYALGGLASVQQNVGLVDLALDNLRESQRLIAELRSVEPDNNHYQRLSLVRRSTILGLLERTGQEDAAAEGIEALDHDWRDFFAAGQSPDVRAWVQFVDFLTLASDLAYSSGDSLRGERLLNEAFAVLRDATAQTSGLSSAYGALVAAEYTYWSRNGQAPPANVVPPQAADFDVDRPLRGCEEVSQAARMAVVRGELARAARYTSYLLDKGYYEPGFIRFCQAQALCDG